MLALSLRLGRCLSLHMRSTRCPEVLLYVPWGSSPDSSPRRGVWWSDYCCWLTSISFARLCEVGQLGWCWHADMGVILIYFGCRSNLGVCTKVHCSGHICGLRHPPSLSMCKHCCRCCCINTQGLYFRCHYAPCHWYLGQLPHPLVGSLPWIKHSFGSGYTYHFWGLSRFFITTGLFFFQFFK